MSLSQRMLINLGYKLLVFPLVIYSGTLLLPAYLFFQTWKPFLFISILFILIGVVADEVVLPIFGINTSTIQGGIFMVAASWMLPFLFKNTVVSLLGAAYIGVALGIVEYIMHHWIRRQQRMANGEVAKSR